MAANTTRKPQTRKKNTSGNGTRGRKPVERKNSKSVEQRNNTILREAILLIVIAFSIILFITNFGVGGVVGKAVSSFFFGLFGLVAYIFPLLLIAGTLIGVSNRKNSVVRIKLIHIKQL